MTWEQKIKDYLYPKLDNKLYKVEFKGMNDIYAGKDGMINMAIWSIQRYLLQLELFYGKGVADKVDVIEMIPKFVTKHFNNMSNTDNRPTRQPTFGEKAVGISFNPSNDSKVDKAKLLLAEAIDLLEEAHAERTSKGSAIPSWHASVFRTEAFNALTKASMSLVNYLTWKD